MSQGRAAATNHRETSPHFQQVNQHAAADVGAPSASNSDHEMAVNPMRDEPSLEQSYESLFLAEAEQFDQPFNLMEDAEALKVPADESKEALLEIERHPGFADQEYCVSKKFDLRVKL